MERHSAIRGYTHPGNAFRAGLVTNCYGGFCRKCKRYVHERKGILLSRVGSGWSGMPGWIVLCTDCHRSEFPELYDINNNAFRTVAALREAAEADEALRAIREPAPEDVLPF